MTAAAVVLFTRDLRVHDNPALAAAAAQGPVVPLFVLDDALLGGQRCAPNRVSFLVDALHDLRESLEHRGSTLVVRRGDPAGATLAVAAATRASTVHIAADVSSHARNREHRLRRACAASGVELVVHPSATVVPPGELNTGGRAHYRVFTPYWHAWRAHSWRAPARTPRSLHAPSRVPAAQPIPAASELLAGPRSARLPRGGESEGIRRLRHWLRRGIDAYSGTHDGLGDGDTSRLSAYVHFGCISPLHLARHSLRARDDAFLRQLCWRDFHHQVTADFPAITHRDYRPRGQRWRQDVAAFRAWCAGATGVPIVDVAMRQLRQEGWMPNRARLIAAGYLVRTLGIEWRLGADHFMRWLVDGDVANNYGNWQWVAGTGNDTRHNRGFNVERQARRFDPDGAYAARFAGS